MACRRPIVHCPFSGFPAMEVYHVDSKKVSGGSCREGLIAITQKDEALGLQSFEGLRNAVEGLGTQRRHGVWWLPIEG